MSLYLYVRACMYLRERERERESGGGSNFAKNTYIVSRFLKSFFHQYS